MTVAEANNLYDKIVGQILHSDLREAFVNLSYLIQQNGFGLSFDQLNELESNYRFLLKFKLKGVEDPGREKVYADIKRRAHHLHEITESRRKADVSVLIALFSYCREVSKNLKLKKKKT